MDACGQDRLHGVRHPRIPMGDWASGNVRDVSRFRELRRRGFMDRVTNSIFVSYPGTPESFREFSRKSEMAGQDPIMIAGQNAVGFRKFDRRKAMAL